MSSGKKVLMALAIMGAMAAAWAAASIDHQRQVIRRAWMRDPHEFLRRMVESHPSLSDAQLGSSVREYFRFAEGGDRRAHIETILTSGSLALRLTMRDTAADLLLERKTKAQTEVEDVDAELRILQ